MRKHIAEQFLENLEVAFDYSMVPQRRIYYLDALLPLSEERASAAFALLVQRAKKFPTVAEVLGAFEATAESTREVERSRPMSPESRRRADETLRRWLEFEPVHYHPDLYHGYVDALMEYRSGQRTWDDLEQLRRTLIEQARARERPAPRRAPQQPKAEPVREPTGIEASVPKGDRA